MQIMRGRALALYVVVFRPGFIGLLSTCIAIAFLTILASAITILIHHGDDVEFGEWTAVPDRPSAMPMGGALLGRSTTKMGPVRLRPGGAHFLIWGCFRLPIKISRRASMIRTGARDPSGHLGSNGLVHNRSLIFRRYRASGSLRIHGRRTHPEEARGNLGGRCGRVFPTDGVR